MSHAKPHSSVTETKNAPLSLLRVDSSPKSGGSTTKELTDKLIETLRETSEISDVVTRDTTDLPYIDSNWIGGNFTAAEDWSEDQQAVMAVSEDLVAELKAADIIVIGAPMYNFSITASLKAWLDQIFRARVTFRYTDNGPVGLLDGKKVFIVSASGGTQIGSDMDFATPYLKFALRFLGLEDVTLVAAERQLADEDAAKKAKEAIAQLAA